MQMLTVPLRRCIGLVALGFVIVAGGCSTMEKASEKASDMAKAVMPGGDTVDMKTHTDKLIGNTSIGTDGTWHRFVREDGVYRLWTESDGVKEGSWRRDDDGVICMTSDGEEKCMGNAKVSLRDGVFSIKDDDDSEKSYRVVSGNSKGL